MIYNYFQIILSNENQKTNFSSNIHVFTFVYIHRIFFLHLALFYCTMWSINVHRQSWKCKLCEVVYIFLTPWIGSECVSGVSQYPEPNLNKLVKVRAETIKTWWGTLHCTKVGKHRPRWTFIAWIFIANEVDFSSALYYHLGLFLMKISKKAFCNESNDLP